MNTLSKYSYNQKTRVKHQCNVNIPITDSPMMSIPTLGFVTKARSRVPLSSPEGGNTSNPGKRMPKYISMNSWIQSLVTIRNRSCQPSIKTVSLPIQGVTCSAGCRSRDRMKSESQHCQPLVCSQPPPGRGVTWTTDCDHRGNIVLVKFGRFNSRVVVL